MKMTRLFLAVLFFCGATVLNGCKTETAPQAPAENGSPVEEAADTGIYAFTMNDIDGNPVKLSAYRGKGMLVVNVASKCGYTKQYAGLQELYRKYKDQGLVVLGFPANNFKEQEPGTNAEIRQFCTDRFSVTFPMFAKISVKGDDIDPLYAYLTGAETNPGFEGDIKWNFNKFLFDRAGKCVGRYDSPVEPMSSELTGDIEKALQ